MTDISPYDKMTLRDARELYMNIEKNEILNGYTFPSKPGKDGYYRIYVTDLSKKSGRRQLFAKSLDDLRDLVYDYERWNVHPSRKEPVAERLSWWALSRDYGYGDAVKVIGPRFKSMELMEGGVLKVSFTGSECGFIVFFARPHPTG